MHTNAIAQSLSSVTLGEAVAFRNMVMVPLLVASSGTDAPAPARARRARPARSAPPARSPMGDYVLLDDALASGAAEITEVSEQGSVPELRLINRSPRPTLIVDGEELVGAKQNRVVNLTILVAAKSELTIPVSCVEAGRWRARTRHFAAAPRTHYASGRARRMAQVSESIRMNRSYHSDQAEVWADIARKSLRMQASSPTSAMEALFVDHEASIEEFVNACAPADGQVGALFAIDDALVGMDLFDRASTLRKLLPKLVRSVAVDALDGDCHQGDCLRFHADPSETVAVPLAGVRKPNTETVAVPLSRIPLAHQVARFIAATSGIPYTTTKAIGLGEDVRMTGSGITGAALVVDGSVIHLSAFNQGVGA